MKFGNGGAMASQIIPFRRKKKKALIVNCFFDEMRFKVGRNTQIPQAMGPAYLAGAFRKEMCDVLLFSEMYSGPLEDETVLAWPDMIVLTGLNTAFDRMLHITAYARSKNPGVIVVAGGPAIRNLPNLSARYFDYVCMGDVEELIQVVEDAFGVDYVADEISPRFDLAYWMNHFGYVESSRYCNFKCAFCTLTGEGHQYQKYNLDFIRSQITDLGKNRDPIVFIDNNFYGNDRQFFLDRIDLITELRKDGYIRRWSAIVTNDFFFREDNLDIVKDAGCMSLFSGIEAFDRNWLRTVNKLQNIKISQVDMVRNCLEKGIVFLYGSVLDVTTRFLTDLKSELAFIFSTHEMTLPSYLSIIVPLLGTPVFYDCLEKGLILPGTKLRDLESTTLCVKPLDPINDVAKFIYDIQTLREYRLAIIAHSWRFFRRYRTRLSPFQMAVALNNATKISFQVTPNKKRLPKTLRSRNRKRTHISTTELLDQVYQPAFPIDRRYQDYFKPTYLTDASGAISSALEADIFKNKAMVGTASGSP